jgi:hypothetical protein
VIGAKPNWQNALDLFLGALISKNYTNKKTPEGGFFVYFLFSPPRF